MDRLTSHKSATIEQFLEMFAKTLKAAWNNPTKTIVDVYEAFPDELKDGKEEKLPPLIVTWEYVREPHPEMREIKPRVRSTFPDPENPSNTITIVAQRFMCTVSFILWSYDQELLRNSNEQFMDFMTAFMGFFKSQGVAEIIFQSERNVTHQMRESLYGRQHVYRVDIEKSTRIDTAKIQEIIAQVLVNGEYHSTEVIHKEE